MRRLNLRNIDLNLLPVLHALLEEECVTQASKRVHLSQSATSAALNRLRKTFGDQILVRDGQRMKPTPKAQQLRESVRLVLDDLSTLVERLSEHDFSQYDGEVCLAAPEHVLITLNQTMLDVFGKKTHQLKLNAKRPQRRLSEELLKNGECDFAIGGYGRLPVTLQRQTLYRERPVVIVRRSHPAVANAADGQMSLKAFTQYPHLVVTEGDRLEDVWITRLLKKRGIQHTVGSQIPNVGAAQRMLENTDMLCVGAQECFASLVRDQELVCLMPPKELGIREYDVDIVWHQRIEQNPQLNWVKDALILASQKQLATAGPNASVAPLADHA